MNIRRIGGVLLLSGFFFGTYVLAGVLDEFTSRLSMQEPGPADPLTPTGVISSFDGLKAAAAVTAVALLLGFVIPRQKRRRRRLQTAQLAKMTVEEIADLISHGDGEPRPGWALLLRSPYETWADSTSWIGGAPMAPPGFRWPRDADGKPMAFLAQIDLASIRAEPSTGQRPASLPGDGALLVFIGKTYAYRLIPAAKMRRAQPVPLPKGLPLLRDRGFFAAGPSFGYWPVVPTPFFDTGEGRPDIMPNPFAQPTDWISNWGLAAKEAEIALKAAQAELDRTRSYLELRAQLQIEGKARDTPVTREKDRHAPQVLEDAPALIAALTRFRDAAAALPPDDAVDQNALAEIFAQRKAFVARMTSRTQASFILPGSPQALWQALVADRGVTPWPKFLQQLPSAFHPFVAAYVTDWRGHRLFGVEPPFINNWEDVTGHTPLISIASDPLLGTETEHAYGLSIWCPTPQLARGRLDNGQLLFHDAG